MSYSNYIKNVYKKLIRYIEILKFNINCSLVINTIFEFLIINRTLIKILVVMLYVLTT